MKRALLLLLFFGAPASAVDFGTFQVESGYAGPLVLDVYWTANSTRDVSTATGTLRVYSTPPSGGAGGTVSFSCSLVASGSPTYRMVCTKTAADLVAPGSYYATVSITQSSVTDVVHGTVQVTGR